MELKTLTREIDDMKFYINQFPARECIKLEKRTITYLAPMLSMLEDVKDLDKEIDFAMIVKGIKEALINLSEEDFLKYIQDMFKFVSIEIKTEEGKPVKTVMVNQEFDTVFIGKNITVYKLLIEVMKVNKFAFFELMGGGGLVTGIFQAAMPKVKKS